MNKINEIKRIKITNYVRNFNIRIDYVGVLSSELYSLNRIGSEFTLIYVLENSLKIKSRGQEVRLEKGDVFYLLNEFTVLENNNSSIYFVAFHPYNSMLINELYQFIISTADTIIKDHNGVLKNYFDIMLLESENHESLYFEAVDKIFSLLMINIIRLSNKNYDIYNYSASNHYFEAASMYVRDNISNAIRIKDIAEELNISEIYLYKIFKSHTGKSVQQYINEYKMNEAIALLDSGKYQVKDIADRLGFSSSNHFSQSFKKRFGVSPKKYSSAK